MGFGGVKTSIYRCDLNGLNHPVGAFLSLVCHSNYIVCIQDYIVVTCIGDSIIIYERRLNMDQDSANLENELNRYTRDAKNIMLLSLISIIIPPLFLVTLLYFLFYSNKRKKLKSDLSLSNKFNGLKDKTTKELRSIKWNSNSLEHSVAGSIHAHKTTVGVLIIIGIVLTSIIVFIGLSYLMEWV